MKRGFTLIELLVVISIISILASVVLAALNSARDKGRLAGARYFSAEVDHIASDSAVGIWDFAECANTTMADRSGNGNGSTIVSGISWSTMSPFNQGCSILMNGTAPISYGSGSGLAAFQFGTGSFTISGWMYPTTAQSSSYSSSALSSWGSVRLGIGIGTSNAVAIMIKDSLANQVSPNATQTVPLNQWSLLTLVVDRTNNVASAYLNGTPTSLYNVNISSITGSMSLDGTVLSGASWGGTTGYFTGNITGVRAYGKALTAREVGEIYALQAPKVLGLKP